MTRPHRGSALALVATLSLLLSGCTGSTTPADGPDANAAPPGGTVWVANEGANTVTVLDARTGEALTTLTSLAAPHNVQASTVRDLVWVTTSGGVVGLDAEDLFPTEVAPAGQHPAHVVEDADGDVYVTAAGDGVVHHFDNALRAGHQIPVGGGPHGMRLSADGHTGVVANTAAGTVDVLDLRAGRKVAAIPVGPSPIQVAIAPDGKTAYAAVSGERKVVRVDLTRRKVTGEATVETDPAQIWLTASGMVLSANQGTDHDPGNTVSLIDAETMTVQDTVTVGSGPHGITVNTEETHAWVTNAYDGTVSVIDLAAATVTDTITVGAYPNGITFSPVTPAKGEHGEQTTLVLPPAYGSTAPDSSDHGHGEHGHGSEDDPSETPAPDEHLDGGGHSH